MPAATLQDAAGLAYKNVARQWQLGVLKAHLQAFWPLIDATFREDQLNDHPIGNWISLISGVANECPVDGANADQFAAMNASAKYIYRLCWLASYLVAQSLITAAQGTVILNAFNAQFP